MQKKTHDKLSSAHEGFRYSVLMEGVPGSRVITIHMWARGDGRGALLGSFNCFPLEWANHVNCTCGRGLSAMREVMGPLGDAPHFERVREMVDHILDSRFREVPTGAPIAMGSTRWRGLQAGAGAVNA